MTAVYEIMIILLLCLAVFCLVVGASFLLLPDKANLVAGKLKLYIQTNPLFFKLDSTHFMEKSIYKRHVLFGTLIMVCSGYAFYELFTFENLIARMPLLVNPVISEILYTSMGYLFMFLLVISFTIGLIVLIRPSMLKKIEQASNLWIDTTEHYENLEQQRAVNMQQPLKWPRVTGLIICVCSMFIIFQCINIYKLI